MKQFVLLCLLAVCACISTLAQTVTTTEPTGVITGRVVLDNGQPAVGATVSATLQSRAARTAVTNAEGEFKLSGLPPAPYALTAQLPAYVMTPLTTATGEPQFFHIGDSATIQLIKGGVITGKATTANDEPVPGLTIKAIRLRDAAGKSLSPSTYHRRTDDRGSYRLFGLPSGTYIVCTDGTDVPWSFDADDQIEDAPTYYPASTRETATELTLASGDELANIDIRYRAERGRLVSGKVIGASGGYGINLYLKPAGSEIILAADWLQVRDRKVEEGIAFQFRGVADGEYDLTADRRNGDDEGGFANPRRIAVRGADVTGVELRLIPYGSLTGKLQLAEDKPPQSNSIKPSAADACASTPKRNSLFEETTIGIHPEEKFLRNESLRVAFSTRQGEFTIRYLTAGRYRFQSQWPNEDWYLRTITLPDARTKHSVDLGRTGLALKAGEKLSGVSIVIGTGAARLTGRVKAPEKFTAPLRVHLVPVEKEAAEDVLRYAETEAGPDGAFTLRQLAPGKYWIIARASEAAHERPLPLAWNQAEHLKLRRAAEVANVVIELQPCQQMKDYVLKYAPQ
ncbi:MAG: carboxypeptidase regulatory-like domain-containing protein [Acidobacteria bacterium]|nr:carboxypeptidase regulatory-like domain-containing protein [Acidobacteriota bacterium]MBI3427631.1 carboxypeptidase regulatory-like domain-containing protein [Acidobacteriota bacterium]